MSTAIRALRLTTAIVCASLMAGVVHAEEMSAQGMKSLDGQVQEIKSDVLDIASELQNLEERLLYPTGTQLSIFVAIEEAQPFRLDAVQIHIDGALAAHHIYSFKELDTLQSGGVQRIFTGSLATGEHQLAVSVVGKLEGGKDYTQDAQFTFDQGIEPDLLGVALAGPGTGEAPIQLHDW